ncbi:MAG: glycosyltransferase family 4 protein [Armatimonadota bacterium]
MRVAFLAHLPPWPATSGGQQKSIQTLEALCAVADVDVYALARSDADERELRGPVPPWFKGKLKVFRIGRGPAQDVIAWLRSRFLLTPWFVERDRNPALGAAVRDTHAQAPYDLLWVDHLQMWGSAALDGVPAVLDAHNIEQDLLLQRSQAGDGFAVFARTDMERVRRFESRVFSIADHVCVIGTADAARVRELAPLATKRTSLLPPAVPVKRSDARIDITKQPTLGFLGSMRWLANRDGMEHFLRETWPILAREIPTLRLVCAGRDTDTFCSAFTREHPEYTERVTGLGSIPDLREFWDRTHIGIAPLRWGGGVKIKLIESWGAGKPTLGTPVATVDIPQDARFHTYATSPDEWCAAIRQLIATGDAYAVATSQALTFADDNHTVAVLQREVAAILRSVVKSTSTEGPH